MSKPTIANPDYGSKTNWGLLTVGETFIPAYSDKSDRIWQVLDIADKGGDHYSVCITTGECIIFDYDDHVYRCKVQYTITQEPS